MKNLFRLPNLFLLAIAIFTFAACTEDDTGGGGFQIPPSVDLLAEAGFLSADATIGANETIKVKLSATEGDNPLKSVEFNQDGVRISDISRITIDGAAASSAAPLLLGANKTSITWEVEITPHADGAADYTFTVEDDAGEVSSTSLNITIQKDPPVLTAPNMTLVLGADSGTRTSLPLAATSPSGAALTTLTVYEGGVASTATDRFWFGGLTAADEIVDGIVTLEGDDVNGFTKTLYIRSSATVGTIDSYTVEVTDANGLTASLDFTVESTQLATPLDGDFKGILLNKDGGMSQGGLDLDTGNNNINSGDPDAEIKDEGIDLALPAASNWKQQISAANNSVLAILTPANFPENFDFDLVESKELVRTAYDAATLVSGASDVVAKDDIFAVYNATLDRYYLLKVTDVSIITTDNQDSYTFDIKW